MLSMQEVWKALESGLLVENHTHAYIMSLVDGVVIDISTKKPVSIHHDCNYSEFKSNEMVPEILPDTIDNMRCPYCSQAQSELVSNSYNSNTHTEDVACNVCEQSWTLHWKLEAISGEHISDEYDVNVDKLDRIIFTKNNKQ